MRGPERLINENVKTTYTGNRIIAASNMSEMVQGGTHITDTIYLNEKGDFGRYNPNDELDYANAQTGTTWTVPWAFAKASMSWTKQELALNKQIHGKKYRTLRYKSVMYQKHQNLWTAINNGIEEEFWAAPHRSRMESGAVVDGARKPYSIPVFINEEADGLPDATIDQGGIDWADAGTVMGISRTVEDKWRSQTETYGFDATSATTMATIFPAMTKLWWKLRFDKLPKKPEYAEKTSSPQVVWCSVQGITNYEAALRANQDTFRGVGKSSGQDPAYDAPTFRNMPLEVISELETALLYRTGTGGAAGVELEGTSLGGAVVESGPRYYFMNAEYLKFITHSEAYCTLTEPMTPYKQPHSRTQVADLWNNTVCRAPRRLGMLTPKGSGANVINA